MNFKLKERWILFATIIISQTGKIADEIRTRELTIDIYLGIMILIYKVYTRFANVICME